MPSDQVVLDEDLDALDASLRAGDTSAAFSCLVTFEARLARYIRGEELVLFPVLERFVDVSMEITARMRSEHGRLRRLLDTLWEVLAQHDRPRGLDTLCALRSVLLLHREKEDRVLAPLLRLGSAAGHDR